MVDCNGRHTFRSGAGKTSLVRLAAALAGQPLVELALSGGTDTADLLGGFEQLEPLRRVQVPAPTAHKWAQACGHMYGAA